VIAPARRAAVDVLRRVNDGRSDLPAALADVRQRLADDRDRALLVELTTGTLRWQGAIDHLVLAFANRPLERLDPEILEVLRVSVYQLLHLDRVPAAAVVNDAVAMARAFRKSSAAGFVNAVLRNVSRSRSKLPLPSRPTAPEQDRAGALAYLSVTLSHPAWLVERWLDRDGFAAAERRAQFDNHPAPLTLRAQTLRVTAGDLQERLAADGVLTHRTRYAPDGLIVDSGNPIGSKAFDEGLGVLQDEASQLVSLMSLAAPGEWVLDACASPGGKTLAMAAAVAPSGHVVAADTRPRRMALLRQTLATAGVAAPLVQLDLHAGAPFGPVFDVVFVDAPCSGLGTIRRDPEIRWRRRPGDLPVFAAQQRQMLDRAANAVKPGGRLVYATCSSEPEENDQVVDAFLASDREFRALPHAEVARRLPAPAAALLDPDGRLRTKPWRDELEAFFAAVMVRLS
jgi:16S rRNA (cytosine967-C5)-methyltransferase